MKHRTVHLILLIFHGTGNDSLLMLLQTGPYAVQNLGFVAGLQQIVPYAEAHGLSGIGKFTEAGKDDELRVQIGLRNPADQLQTVHAGHSDVGQYNVWRFVENHVVGFNSVFAKSDDFNVFLVPVNDAGNGFPDDAFVIRNQQF